MPNIKCSLNDDTTSWMNKELRDVLSGTADGTIFEGEAWIEALFSNIAEDNVKYLIGQRFEERFSYTCVGLLCRTGKASWAEKYGLLSLFRKGMHGMYMPINAKQFSIQNG